VTAAERSRLLAAARVAVEAMELMHRADGVAGERGEWSRRWTAHERAAAELRAALAKMEGRT
jgi:hypothetical protein